MRVRIMSGRVRELLSDPAHVERTLRHVREAIAYLETIQDARETARAAVLRDWYQEQHEAAHALITEKAPAPVADCCGMCGVEGDEYTLCVSTGCCQSCLSWDLRY